MALAQMTYGKDGVRVMRIDRKTDRHEVRELTVRAMMTGDFGGAFTRADNSTSISTDTVKNVVNVTARENLTLGTELFCAAVARKLLEYPQVETATVTGHETKWTRLPVDGTPHVHSFTLDANGKPYAKVVMTRSGSTVESGWANYTKDKYTTIPETHDRMAATAMDASWRWSRAPASYEAANATILATALKVFATTYSNSVQDSLYRMGTAVLEAVPELIDIGMACPNKHYLLINLTPFGLDNNNEVFVATDDPHGQIECTVSRE
jgi:urate oxidase